MEYEGEDTDSDSEEAMEEAFQSLTIDMNPDLNLNTDMSEAETFCTTVGQVEKQEAVSMANLLANKVFTHSFLSTDLEPNSADNDPFTYTTTSISRYNSTQFVGIMVDTGASTRSTAGYGQFLAFQQLDPTAQIDTATQGMVEVQFGIGSSSSLGSYVVATPVGKVEFHIVKADTPFLLSLADMDRLQVYYNNLTNLMVFANVPQREPVPVVRRYGHACYLTDVELKRLHRRFGHPSVERLARILDRSGHEVETQILKHLTQYCHHCQKHGKSPGRFKFVL